MSKPAPNNISFQVTISKETYKTLNGVVAAINQVRDKGDQISRSQFIETLINYYVYSHLAAKDEKEEKN